MKTVPRRTLDALLQARLPMFEAANTSQRNTRFRAEQGAWCIRARPALAVLLLLAGVASRAAASCGDYVTVGAAHSDSHASSYGDEPADDLSPPAPLCRGLHCQRRLPTPATPDKSLVGPGPQEWAWHAVLTDAESRIVGLAPPRPVRTDLEGHLSRLLRPPIVAARWL